VRHMNIESILKSEQKSLFLKFLLPSIFAMIGVSINILCDTIFIGKGVGQGGLSALGIAIPVYNIYNAISLLIGMGGATLYAINIGKGNHKEAQNIFSASLTLGVVVGLIISILGFIFSREVSIFFGAKGDILGLTDDYLKVILLAGFNFILSGILVPFLRNDGAPRLAMIAVIAGNMTNIVLDYIFIFILDMGIRGAAIATGLAPIVTLSIIGSRFLLKGGSLRFRLQKINGKISSSILKLGLSSSFTEVSGAVVIISFNYRILGLLGEVGIAAYSIIANIAMIGVAILSGVAQAMQPLISINYGANEYERAIDFRRLGFISAFSIGLVFFLIAGVFSEPIIRLFSVEEKYLIDLTKTGIRIYFTGFLFIGCNIVSIAYFQAIGEAKKSNTLSLFKGLVFVLFNLIVLPFIWGINGVWLTIPIAEAMTLGVSLLLLFKVKETSRP